MKVGVFTALLANLSLDQVIARLTELGITTVELGTGNYPATRTASCLCSRTPPPSATLSLYSPTTAYPSAP